MVDNLEVYETVKKHICRSWTDAETNLFRATYASMPVKELEVLLNRTKRSIWGKAHIMGLKLFDPKLIRPHLQPSEALFYIIGVLKGDGSISVDGYNHHCVRLQVKDRAFAESFARNLTKIGVHPHLSIKKSQERPPYNVIGHSRILVDWYSHLSLENIKSLLTMPQYAISFIRGFYESEGTFVHVWRQKRKQHQWRVAIYNNDLLLLKLVQCVLKDLGFNFHLQKGTLHKPHLFRGHMIITKKPVYSLDIQSRQEISDFLSLINPCIKAEKSKLSLAHHGGK